MNILVLEESVHIVNIYKKLFGKKEIIAEFANNESEFLEKFNENFDFFILKDSNLLDFSSGKIQDIIESEKFINLSSFIKKNENLSHIRKESRDIIEKPFAMVELLAKLEFLTMKNKVVI